MALSRRPLGAAQGASVPRLSALTPASVDLADAVAAIVERGQAGVEMAAEQGHVEQFVDPLVGAELVRLGEGLVPFAGIVGAAPDPGQRQRSRRAGPRRDRRAAPGPPPRRRRSARPRAPTAPRRPRRLDRRHCPGSSSGSCAGTCASSSLARRISRQMVSSGVSNSMVVSPCRGIAKRQGARPVPALKSAPPALQLTARAPLPIAPRRGRPRRRLPLGRSSSAG